MLCWWCCHETQGNLHLPISYDDRTKKYKFWGNFCSWECMKAFSIDTYGINKGGLINSYIKLLRRETEGKMVDTKRAPSKWLLNIFGGPLTIEEFRNNTNITVPIIDEMGIQVIPIQKKGYSQTIRVNTNNDSNETYHMNQIQNASGANDTLKLRRPKPLNKNQSGNDLEKSLGIIRNSHPQ